MTCTHARTHARSHTHTGCVPHMRVCHVLVQIGTCILGAQAFFLCVVRALARVLKSLWEFSSDGSKGSSRHWRTPAWWKPVTSMFSVRELTSHGRRCASLASFGRHGSQAAGHHVGSPRAWTPVRKKAPWLARRGRSSGHVKMAGVAIWPVNVITELHQLKKHQDVDMRTVHIVQTNA